MLIDGITAIVGAFTLIALDGDVDFCAFGLTAAILLVDGAADVGCTFGYKENVFLLPHGVIYTRKG